MIYSFVKRFLDFFVSLVAVLVLSFLLVPIMILLKLTGEHKVFYLQERMGFKNQPFSIYKFATMLENSLNMGLGSTTVRNDPRITKVGKYLRMSKVNELPQLFNVLLGHMSFVGPRPLPEKSFSKYSSDVKEVIYKNRPGITGLGSLVFRDEEKLVTIVVENGFDNRAFYKNHVFPYKGELEQWYYNNQSFWVDLKILVLTFWYVVSANSNLLFKAFKNLPTKPDALDSNKILDILKQEA